jgi:hypothetical protein
MVNQLEGFVEEGAQYMELSTGESLEREGTTVMGRYEIGRPAPGPCNTRFLHHKIFIKLECIRLHF